MASSDLETRAKEAFIDDHFELAVDLYTQAITMTPNNADLYADRAQANIKLQYFTDAVADASKAIELNPAMVKAYLRKGMACMKLEEYETAKAALERGASLAPGDSRFTNLIKECVAHIAEESEELPKQFVNKASMDAVAPSDLSQPIGLSTQGASPSATKPNYRHEFYQKPEEVVVTIFAKSIPAGSIVVDFGEQILSVTIELPGQEAYHFQPRLFGKIIPSKCRYNVLSTKIEIRLAKADNEHWASLEFKSGSAVVPQANTSIGNRRPTYPSSKLRTDWDKLEALVKEEEKAENLDGDAALNKFFSDIYRDADEDTRRAMSKSFLESNGTVLSTDWNEVGSRKVEGSPPDGMEFKKWLP